MTLNLYLFQSIVNCMFSHLHNGDNNICLLALWGRISEIMNVSLTTKPGTY